MIICNGRQPTPYELLHAFIKTGSSATEIIEYAYELGLELEDIVIVTLHAED
jgi:hypothetical protein